jgi:TonB family protein
MTALSAKMVDIYPNYGAKELKLHIRKNTYEGFAITTAFVVIAFILFLAKFMSTIEIPLQVTYKPSGPIQIDKFKNEEPVIITMQLPVDKYFAKASNEMAGKFKPIEDALFKPTEKEFAPVGQIPSGSDANGTEPFNAGFGNTPNGLGDFQVEVKKPVDKEPSPEEFVELEQEPGFDMARMAKLVKYPELARKIGIEGKVLVRVLIDKDGSIKKQFIDNSDNPMLDQAAMDAIKEYGKFIPAIQNGETIMVWVTIPIQFRLK